MKRPVYISIEGIDTTGKTTLASAMLKHFAAAGSIVGLKPESPSDVEVAARINDALKHSIFVSHGFEHGPRAALLYMLYAECLAYQQVSQDVQLVVADRGIDSIAVYQGAALQASEPVGAEALLDALELLYFSIGGRIPDLTILLAISSDRLQRRFHARHGRKPTEFELDELVRLQARYQHIASVRPRYIVLDADMSGPDLLTAAVKRVETQFDLRALH